MTHILNILRFRMEMWYHNLSMVLNHWLVPALYTPSNSPTLDSYSQANKLLPGN